MRTLMLNTKELKATALYAYAFIRPCRKSLHSSLFDRVKLELNALI